ncbi:MAG: RNA polymerase sigma factor [Candidatus Binatia bacterium]
MGVAAAGWQSESPVSAAAKDFGAFVESRSERAIRVAYRLVGGDRGAAEDVAQNAFVRAYRALGSFRGESSLDTWFYRILVREAHRHRRWHAVRKLWSASAEDAPEPADERPTGDPGLRRRILAALDKLSPAQRDTFVLVHLEGFSITDAAATLGKAPGTLKSHLHRALVSLREELRDLAVKEGMA